MSFEKFCAGLMLLEMADNGKAGICQTEIAQFKDVTCWVLKRRLLFPKVVIRKIKFRTIPHYTPLIFSSREDAKIFLDRHKQLVEKYLS